MKVLITARVLLVASLAWLVGCGGGSSAPITPLPPTLSISPGSATLSPSASVQFTAHLGNSTPSVNWSLSGAACSGAVCGAVDASGLYKAPASVTGNLTVRVTAALQSDLMKTSSANVTVTGSSSGKATLTPTSA